MDWPAPPSWCPICCDHDQITVIKPMEHGLFLAHCKGCTRPILLDRYGQIVKRADDIRG